MTQVVFVPVVTPNGQQGFMPIPANGPIMSPQGRMGNPSFAAADSLAASVESQWGAQAMLSGRAGSAGEAQLQAIWPQLMPDTPYPGGSQAGAGSTMMGGIPPQMMSDPMAQMGQMGQNFQMGQIWQWLSQFAANVNQRLSNLEKNSQAERTESTTSTEEASETKREMAHVETDSMTKYLKKIKSGETAFKFSTEERIKERQIKYLDKLIDKYSDLDEQIDAPGNFTYQKDSIYNKAILKQIGLEFLKKDPQWCKENQGDFDLSNGQTEFIKNVYKFHKELMKKTEDAA